MSLFKKSVLATALVTAVVMPVYAADAVNVYGKLNVTAQYNDAEMVNNAQIMSDSDTTIQSNSSRLGVKGAYQISSQLEAFYMIEYEVDTGDAAKDNFEARNQFVGLRGDFGAVSVGRNDTMLKMSQGKVDLFGDLAGDIKNLFKGENRIEQTATYVTPVFNQVQLGVTYAADGSSSQMDENGFSVAAMYGDSKLKKSPVFASVAYDSKVKGYDIVRATVQGKVAGFKLGAMYQQQEKSNSNSSSVSGFMLSAAYSIDDITLKTQYQTMDELGDSWSLGADYKLAKPTKVFAFYTMRDYDQMAYASQDNMGQDVVVLAELQDKYFGLGIEHKF